MKKIFIILVLLTGFLYPQTEVFIVRNKIDTLRIDLRELDNKIGVQPDNIDLTAAIATLTAYIDEQDGVLQAQINGILNMLQDTSTVSVAPLFVLSSDSISFSSVYQASTTSYLSVDLLNDSTGIGIVDSVEGLDTPFSITYSYNGGNASLPFSLPASATLNMNIAFDNSATDSVYTDTLMIYGSDTMQVIVNGTILAEVIPEPPTIVGIEDTVNFADLQALVSGTVYVLDKDHASSSDANAGTSESAPLKTWSAAVNKLQAGDGLLIKKSATPYTSGTFSTSIAGTYSNRIIIRGQYLQDKPSINFSSSYITWSNGYITLEALEFTGVGGHTASGKYFYLRGMKIVGASTGQECIRFRDDYGIVEYSELSGAGRNGINVYPQLGQRLVGTIIRYNYIHDNTAHHGINIFPYVSSSGGSDLDPKHIDSVKIYGNRIERSQWAMYTRMMTSFQIYNNIIANCTEGGIYLGYNYDSNNAGSTDSTRYGSYNSQGGLIANNTIYNSKATYGCAIDNRACDYVKIYNNAIWASASTSDGVQWRFYNYLAPQAPTNYNHQPTVGHTIDYNMTSTDGGSVLWGTGKISLATWHTNYCTNYIAATPQIDYSTGTDVVWNLTGSFYGSSGASNIVGAGIDLSAYFTEDYYRNTRSSWDIGATEYVP